MGLGTFFRALARRKKVRIEFQSKTPILDLLEPPPKPYDEIVTGKFAFPFLTAVAFVVIGGNLSFLLVLFGLLLILFLAVAVHELGHLVAGQCVGLEFNGVKIGPISIKRFRHKWSASFLSSIHRGEAQMSIDRVRRIRRRLALFILGGSVASYVCGISAFVGGEVIRTQSGSGWAVFLGFFGFVSFFLGVLSSIPYRVGHLGSDADLLRQLLRSREGSTRMIASYALVYISLTKPARPTYFQRWWYLAEKLAHPTLADYYANWNSYRSAQDEATAAQALERLLANSAFLQQEAREHLMAEAAYFWAWRRNDAAKAQIWLQRVKRPEWFGPLAHLRVEIALCCARRHFEQALTMCNDAVAMLDNYQNGQEFEPAKAEWINWKDLIQQEIAIAAAHDEVAPQTIDV